jgi:uncharacterized RDD family membrane protein YckC
MEKKFAGFWLRFVAILLDGLVLWGFMFILSFPLFYLFGFHLNTGNLHRIKEIFSAFPQPAPHRNPPLEFDKTFATNFIISLIIEWLYFGIMESSKYMATLGKLAVRIEVTDTAGNKLTFGRASARFFTKYVSYLTLFIGFIMAGFTSKKQALHDMIAGCLVVKKD